VTLATLLTYTVATLAGYLIGAIPFGYLIVSWLKGIDIRTVGSGNVGATNVGRTLGFRYFLLVFFLDLLKGYLPTVGVPQLVRSLGASPPLDLPVPVALATILGHNFPVYLRFRGGKGVATSCGALLALDPSAFLAAAGGFFVAFVLSRIVSVASMTGALAFLAAHFARTQNPWGRDELAMSLFSIAVVVLVVARHRKNIGRLLAGTEPRVPFRFRRSGCCNDPPVQRPQGKIQTFLVAAIAVVIAVAGTVSWAVWQAGKDIQAEAGPWRLREVSRITTGEQRATRLAFAAEGRQLAVLCPRYQRVLIYQIDDLCRLRLTAKVELDGRPIALAALSDRLVVLQRPPGDDLHLKPGWWDTFSFDGRAIGPTVSAGFYPDDLVLTPDGRFLLLASSGRAEGDGQKPPPAIEVFSASGGEAGQPVALGKLALAASENPERIHLSAAGTRALVSLARSSLALAVDLAHPELPRLVGQLELPTSGRPYLSASPDGDWLLMPGSSEAEAVPLPPLAETKSTLNSESTRPPALVCVAPEESALEVIQTEPQRLLGRFPILGPFNLGGSRPAGLAYSANRQLLAVATKPGSVHLISVLRNIPSPPSPNVAGRPPASMPR
jgi:acyl-phosphate glycerol 3-phosphate acyltransferase